MFCCKLLAADLENLHKPFTGFGFVVGDLPVGYVDAVFCESLNNPTVCGAFTDQLEYKLNALFNFGFRGAFAWHYPYISYSDPSLPGSVGLVGLQPLLT